MLDDLVDDWRESRSFSAENRESEADGIASFQADLLHVVHFAWRTPKTNRTAAGIRGCSVAGKWRNKFLFCVCSPSAISVSHINVTNSFHPISVWYTLLVPPLPYTCRPQIPSNYPIHSNITLSTQSAFLTLFSQSCPAYSHAALKV